MRGLFGKKKSTKTLRIGLLTVGQPMVEKTFEDGDKITIGTSEGNSLVLKSKILPKKFILFKPEDDRYLLHFLPEMDGKVAINDAAMTFQMLKQKGIVETTKGQHRISISNKTRGKITFENYRILFRFDDAGPK